MENGLLYVLAFSAMAIALLACVLPNNYDNLSGFPQIGDYNYIISINGSNYIAAVNNGTTVLSTTNASYLFNTVASWLTAGGKIYVNTGKYNLTHTFSVTNPYITIEGHNRGDTILEPTENLTNFLYLSAATMFTLREMQLKGDLTGVTTGHGINVNQVSDIFIEKCYIHGFGYDGIRMEQTWGAIVKENYIEANGGYNTTYSNLYMYACEDSIIEGNTLSWGRRGIYLSGGSGSGNLGCPSTNLITHNEIFDNNMQGIRCDGAVTRYTISNNWLHGNGRASVNTYAAIDFAGAPVYNLITNNVIDGLYDNTQTTKFGVYFWSGTDNIVSDNMILQTTYYGIIEDPDGAANYNIFSSNNVRGCTSEIYVKGANTISVDNIV